jgi:hypothetical protein
LLLGTQLLLYIHCSRIYVPKTSIGVCRRSIWHQQQHHPFLSSTTIHDAHHLHTTMSLIAVTAQHPRRQPRATTARCQTSTTQQRHITNRMSWQGRRDVRTHRLTMATCNVITVGCFRPGGESPNPLVSHCSLMQHV